MNTIFLLSLFSEGRRAQEIISQIYGLAFLDLRYFLSFSRTIF